MRESRYGKDLHSLLNHKYSFFANSELQEYDETFSAIAFSLNPYIYAALSSSGNLAPKLTLT